MWNPENLAMRLNLANWIQRAKKPDARSYATEWAELIETKRPDVIVYNETKLPGRDGKKRKGMFTSERAVQDAEIFHEDLGYRVAISFSQDGRAKHGTALAFREDIKVTHIKRGFGDEPEEEGRLTLVRVETEPHVFRADLTVYLDIDPQLGLSRAKARGALDRIELEKIEFFNRVSDKYRQLAAEDDKVQSIDASEPMAEVHGNVRKTIENFIIKTAGK